MNIRVDLNTPITDGKEVVFRSPVDCSEVTGLIVYYDGYSQEFAFADAHGKNVGDIDHLFAENVAVKVILDTVHSMAFVQNADTNAYIERTFDSLMQSRDNSVLNKDSTFVNGWIYDDGIFEGDEKYPLVSNYVKLQKGIIYQCDYLYIDKYIDFDSFDLVEERLTSPRGIYLYNSDKSFSRKLSLPDEQTNIVLQGDEAYLRIALHPSQADINSLETLMIYPKNEGHVKTTLNPDLVIPQLEEFKQGGGYTPEKGKDYWTEEDIAQIKSYVDDAILGGEW